MAIENLDALERFIELPEGKKLSDLIAAEEKHELKLNDKLKIFETDAFNTLIENNKTDDKTAGREMLLKEMRDKAGLEYEGVKNPDLFIENLSNSVRDKTLLDAKIEPDKKITELTGDLDSLRLKLTAKDTEIETLNNKFSSFENENKTANFLMKGIPEKTIIPRDQVLTLTKNADFKVKFEGEKPQIFKNGELVKDDIKNPVDALEYIKTFTAQYAVKPEGGAGGSDETGGGAGNYEAFVKEMKEQGHSEASEAFMKEAGKRKTAGTLKM